MEVICLKNTVSFLFRKCHNDESTIPPWKQAVLDQITSGISSVIDQLSKTVPSANNKSTVNIPTPTTSNLSPRKEQLEHAKRALDFEEEEKENSQQKGNIIILRGGSQITFASLGGWVVQNLEKLQTL